MEEKKKKELIKRIVLLCCAAALLVICVIAYSLGWFTFNKETSSDGTQMKSVDQPFELVTRGAAYTNGSFPPGYELLKNIGSSDFGDMVGDGENKLKNKTGEYLVTDPANSSDSERKFAYAINWLLSDESNFNNYTVDDNAEEFGLKPGSHGKLVFYIKPDENKMPMDISCYLNVIPYSVSEVTEYDGNNDPVKKNVYSEIKSDDDKASVIKFLKGHILFFRDYKTISSDPEVGVYANPVEIVDDQVQFDVKVDQTTIDPETKEVEVELYWVWARTLPELLLDSSDPNLLGRQNLIEDIPAEAHEGKTDKEIIVDMIQKNNSCFFPSTENVSNTLITALAEKGNYQKADYIKLCSAYNQVDQYIGTNVQFVILDLTCSIK